MAEEKIEMLAEDLPVPIFRVPYQCGYWGRLHPPRVEGDKVVVEEGVGYRSNKHFHIQKIFIIDKDDKGVLIKVWKNGDRGFFATRKTYLIGRDNGQIFVTQVPNTTKTVVQAYQYLVPAEARKPGTLRQGDIFFIPIKRKIPPEAFKMAEIRGSHRGLVAEVGKTMYATGVITHPQHGKLDLGSGVFKVVFAKVASRSFRRRGD